MEVVKFSEKDFVVLNPSFLRYAPGEGEGGRLHEYQMADAVVRHYFPDSDAWTVFRGRKPPHIWEQSEDLERIREDSSASVWLAKKTVITIDPSSGTFTVETETVEKKYFKDGYTVSDSECGIGTMGDSW